MDNLQFKIVADWIITARCPLRCDHCIVGELVANASQRRGEELNTQECKDLIDFLWDHGTRVLSITGGEALTRNDLFEIIDYGHERGMKVCLYTTGLPFFSLKSMTLRVKKANAVLRRVDFLGISIDTFHDEALNMVRASAYCEQLIKALYAHARANYPEVEIQFFTVLGRRNGTASVDDIVAECEFVAGVIDSVGSAYGTRIRWRLSPFRFNPGSMLPFQKKLLLQGDEYERIVNHLNDKLGDNDSFSMHFGVDYDSFFVYPNGAFRTVILDKDGIDRFIEIGDFRTGEINHPDVWNELHSKDGQTARRMKRKDLIPLHDRS